MSDLVPTTIRLKLHGQTNANHEQIDGDLIKI